MARSLKAKAALLTGVAFFFVLFTLLGAWQLQRREWKHALIERVEARVHAAPAASFEPDAEYTHVRLEGRFESASLRAQANTVLGAGFWELTPFRLDSGAYVLINRGFVPLGEHSAPPPSGPQTVTGLLRLSEPVGSLLRRNELGRWYSRDVQAMAAQLGLTVQPFFVDQDEHGPKEAWPQGGLTVIHFPDNHLQYALTWFAMAALCLGAGYVVLRNDNRGQHAAD